jgi:hypothetical protein
VSGQLESNPFWKLLLQVATVALANKMARMAWAVLFKGEAYRPPTAPQVIAA